MSKVNENFLFDFASSYDNDSGSSIDDCVKSQFYHQSLFREEETEQNYDYDSSMNFNFFSSSPVIDEEHKDNFNMEVKQFCKKKSKSVISENFTNESEFDKKSVKSCDFSNKRPMDKEIKEKKFWTKFEDDLLLGFINKNQTKNWRLISEHIKTKSPQQCAYRYGKLLSDMSKKKWHRKDDIRLIELVETHGQNWELIANHIGDRSQRDVESRYKDKLDPNVKNTKFTEEEDTLVKKLYEEFGNDWFHIARYFKNRNAKMIKKRFQTCLKFDCKPTKRFRNKSISIETASTCTNSRVPSPRDSANADAEKKVVVNFENQDIEIDEQNNNIFNVDMFFDKKSQKEFDILDVNNLKIDMFSSFSTQIENLDNYYGQLSTFYKQKSMELESVLAVSNGLGLEINNIFNINSQVSCRVEYLMSQINKLNDQRQFLSTEESCKIHIVSYIELILQLIQQIKIKMNMLWTLTKQGGRI